MLNVFFGPFQNRLGYKKYKLAVSVLLMHWRNLFSWLTKNIKKWKFQTFHNQQLIVGKTKQKHFFKACFGYCFFCRARVQTSHQSTWVAKPRPRIFQHQAQRQRRNSEAVSWTLTERLVEILICIKKFMFSSIDFAAKQAIKPQI